MKRNFKTIKDLIIQDLNLVLGVAIGAAVTHALLSVISKVSGL